MSEVPLTRFLVEVSVDGGVWLPMGEATPDFAEHERRYNQTVAGCDPSTRARLLRLEPHVEEESAGQSGPLAK